MRLVWTECQFIFRISSLEFVFSLHSVSKKKKKRAIYNAYYVWAEAASLNQKCHAIYSFCISSTFQNEKHSSPHTHTHTPEHTFSDFSRLSRWISILCFFLSLFAILFPFWVSGFGIYINKKNIHNVSLIIIIIILPFRWMYKRIISNYSHFADTVART